MLPRTFAGLACVLAAITACAGSAPAPSPRAACAFARRIQALPAPDSMVYPAPGSTAIPDGNFTLVLEFSDNPVYIVAGGTNATPAPGAPMLAATAVPSPLPSPAATPGTPSSWAGYTVGPLRASTTYQVVTDQPTSDNPCAVTSPQPGSIGSFTTR